MKETANPYGAPAPGQFEKEPRASRFATFAVWCGIVPQLVLGFVGVYAVVNWLVRLLTVKMPFTDFLALMGPRGAILLTLIVTLPLPLAYGIYKRSRICAALTMLQWVAISTWAIAEGAPLWDWAATIPAAFILSGFLSLLGTLLHHRRS